MLTAEQVIDRLLAVGFVRGMAINCVLPAVRYGTEWRFRRTDLDAWIERHSTITAKPDQADAG